ncbi:MAG: hypothetical protein WCI18_05085 [Pseudomonadota bacterium]
MASRLNFFDFFLTCLLVAHLTSKLSAPAYAQGTAKDLEGTVDDPLRKGVDLPPSLSECSRIIEQEKAESEARKMIGDRCQAINEKLSSLGQPHCERNLCFSSWRSPGARKVEVAATIWNATAYSPTPGLSVTFAIFFDSNNEGIFDCIDVTAPLFSLDELKDYQLYQDILERRQLCKES